MPDMRFIEQRRGDLLGIIITHAHEDHIGALMDLWPRLQAPVYATPFAASLLEIRRFNEPGAHEDPDDGRRRGTRLPLGPFEVEFIAMAHSIPESTALGDPHPVGTVRPYRRLEDRPARPARAG